MAEKSTIQLQDLYFDPQNPRLPKHLLGVTDEKKIIEYMVRYGNIVELMQSIGETGYSEAEPLLVVPDATITGKYIVVEGNRRLAALKLLSSPELTTLRRTLISNVLSEVKYKPTQIPVIIYPQRNDVLDYLGYRHITGVKDWGALEKARYLDQLYSLHIDQLGKDKIYPVLAKMIGSRSDYVAKLHTALRLYDHANDEAYYGAEIEEKDFNFSWLTTALSFTGTVSYLGLESPGDSDLSHLNEDNFKQLFVWMFDPKKKKIDDSRQITELNKIIEAPQALEKLKSGSSISEAILYTSAPNETFLELIEKAKSALQSCKNMIEQLSSYPQEASAGLEDIGKLCKSIKGALEENFAVDAENTTDIFQRLTNEQKQILMKLISEKQGD